MTRIDSVREHVLWLLEGGHAHLGFDRATEGVPLEAVAKAAAGQPNTLWELVEHIRLAQRDILDYCRATSPGDYDEPKWPHGYWPEDRGPADAAAWQASRDTFRADAAALRQWIADPQRDLFAPLPVCHEHTLMRQALIVADHNAYHLGQMVVLRKALGVWHAD
jgi:uncharacterized damage-inducible protein DinB